MIWNKQQFFIMVGRWCFYQAFLKVQCLGPLYRRTLFRNGIPLSFPEAARQQTPWLSNRMIAGSSCSIIILKDGTLAASFCIRKEVSPLNLSRDRGRSKKRKTGHFTKLQIEICRAKKWKYIKNRGGKMVLQQDESNCCRALRYRQMLMKVKLSKQIITQRVFSPFAATLHICSDNFPTNQELTSPTL